MDPEVPARGPLAGTRVVELSGRGPVPFTAMLLADMGAEVLRVARPDEAPPLDAADPVLRGRPVVHADLKDPATAAAIRAVIGRAEVLIEGFRPGVMERLGLGPAAWAASNPALVYVRVTGWGQTGPDAQAAGHDINYLAATGVLHAIGRPGQPPVPPLNLLGDYGGGGMLAGFGLVCALLEARRSGRGQVVDAAMVDGVSLLATSLHGARQSGRWNGTRGENLLDSGAPFYNVYETSDGYHVSVGALEGKFYRELVTALRLPRSVTRDRMNRSRWPGMRAAFAAAFRERPRAQWCEVFAGRDACFAPVLSPGEAAAAPASGARESFVAIGGVVQPAPAPRFSRTPASVPADVTASDLIRRWGVPDDAALRLLAADPC
jgi:alpha-methylacyl-CoA racemase